MMNIFGGEAKSANFREIFFDVRQSAPNEIERALDLLISMSLLFARFALFCRTSIDDERRVRGAADANGSAYKNKALAPLDSPLL